MILEAEKIPNSYSIQKILDSIGLKSRCLMHQCRKKGKVLISSVHQFSCKRKSHRELHFFLTKRLERRTSQFMPAFLAARSITSKPVIFFSTISGNPKGRRLDNHATQDFVPLQILDGGGFFFNRSLVT